MNPQLIRLIGLLLSLIISTVPSAIAQGEDSTAENPAETDPKRQFSGTQAFMADVAKGLQQGQLQWLQADQQFLSIYAPRRAGTNRGAVILLPGSGQHAAMEPNLKRIHDYLPDFGWHCLSLSLQNYTEDSKPGALDSVHARNSTEANADDTGREVGDDEIATATTSPSPSASSDPLRPVSNVEKRLAAAVQFLLSQGQTDISFVAVGTSAAETALYLNTLDSQDSTQGALIMIDAKHRLDSHKTAFIKALQELTLPMLDIAFTHDREALTDAMQRQRVLIDGKGKNYQLLRLSSAQQTLNQGPDQLAKRVRGWLKAN